MSPAALWVVSIVVILLIGLAATFFIRRVLMVRDETDAGLVALSAMSWREFIHLVLEVLARRGYSRLVDRGAPAGDGDYTLVRDGGHWLLSCKHGSAFVLGAAALNELASNIRLQGAEGGLLVTQGRIAEDARAPAKLQRIEVLDGTTLWPEIRDLIPPGQLDSIRAGAGQRARQRVLLAWMLALLAGIAAFTLLPRADPAPAAAGTPAAGAQPAAAAAGDTAATPNAAPDAAALERQRADLARAVSTLPMVDRAGWSTSSNLVVLLLETDSDAFAAICPLVESYPALSSSRIQLNPPQGSSAQVRFRQCRSY